MKATDDLSESLNVVVSDAILQRREAASQNRLLKAEDNANRAFVQAQLKDKRQRCADSIGKHDELMKGLSTKIEIYSKMVDLIAGSTTMSELTDISNLISAVSESFNQKINAMELIQTATSTEDLRQQFLSVLESSIAAAKVLLGNETNATIIEQSHCDQQIRRLQSQLSALMN